MRQSGSGLAGRRAGGSQPGTALRLPGGDTPRYLPGRFIAADNTVEAVRVALQLTRLEGPLEIRRSSTARHAGDVRALTRPSGAIRPWKEPSAAVPVHTPRTVPRMPFLRRLMGACKSQSVKSVQLLATIVPSTSLSGTVAWVRRAADDAADVDSHAL